MKKSFKEIQNEFVIASRSSNFESQIGGTKFDVEMLEATRKFLNGCTQKHQQKIEMNIQIAQERLDPKLLKKLTDVLWEFRTWQENSQYRLLAFWIRRQNSRPLIVITHGFLKKVNKIPRHELDRAMKIRQDYLMKHQDEKKTKD